jgi:hypothetical protein
MNHDEAVQKALDIHPCYQRILWIEKQQELSLSNLCQLMRDTVQFTFATHGNMNKDGSWKQIVHSTIATTTFSFLHLYTDVAPNILASPRGESSLDAKFIDSVLATGGQALMDDFSKRLAELICITWASVAAADEQVESSVLFAVDAIFDSSEDDGKAARLINSVLRNQVEAEFVQSNQTFEGLAGVGWNMSLRDLYNLSFRLWGHEDYAWPMDIIKKITASNEELGAAMSVQRRGKDESGHIAAWSALIMIYAVMYMVHMYSYDDFCKIIVTSLKDSVEFSAEQYVRGRVNNPFLDGVFQGFEGGQGPSFTIKFGSSDDDQ